MTEQHLALLLVERENIKSKFGGKIAKLFLAAIATYFLVKGLENSSVFLAAIVCGSIIYFMLSLVGTLSTICGNYLIGVGLAIGGILLLAFGFDAISTKFGVVANSIGDYITFAIFLAIVALPIIFDIYKTIKFFKITALLKSCDCVYSEQQVEETVE